MASFYAPHHLTPNTTTNTTTTIDGDDDDRTPSMDDGQLAEPLRHVPEWPPYRIPRRTTAA